MSDPRSAPTAVVQVTRLVSSRLIVAVSAGVISVLAARALGPLGRGYLALGLQASYAAAYLLAAGLERAVPDIGDGKGFLDLFAGSVLALRRQLTLLIGLTVLLLALAEVGHGLLLYVLALGSINAILGLIHRALRIAATTTGRVVAVEFTSILYGCLSLLACGALFIGGSRSPLTWLLSLNFALAAPLLMLIVPLRRRLRGDEQVNRLAASVSAGTRPHRSGALAHVVSLRGERLLLPLLAGPTELGLYMAVATLAEVITWPAQAAFEVLMPRMYRTGGVSRATLGWVFGGSGLLCVLMYPLSRLVIEPNVVRVLGESFASARVLVFPMLLSSCVYTLSRLTVAQGLAQRDPRMKWTEPLAVAVSLPALALLINGAGAAGAAWGVLLMYTATAVITAWISLDRRGPQHQHR